MTRFWKILKIGLIINLVIASSACVTKLEYHQVDLSCVRFKPIRPSLEDVDETPMSRGLSEQVLAHNRVGAEVCGWRP